jgi:predicted outer membrane protein
MARDPAARDTLSAGARTPAGDTVGGRAAAPMSASASLTPPRAANTAEIREAQLAAKRASSPEVRQLVEHPVQLHEQPINKIEKQLLPAAESPELKSFLQKTVDTMRGHLASAKQVQQDLGSSSAG